MNNGDFERQMAHAISHLGLEKALHKSLSHHYKAEIWPAPSDDGNESCEELIKKLPLL